jgi:heterotetrameric sarcosine oxidase gamma subunit
VTDTAPTLEVRLAAPDALIQIELWGDTAAVGARLMQSLGAALPAPCRSTTAGALRLMWWEPHTWLVRAPRLDREATLDLLAGGLGEDGAATDVSGGFQRLRIEGPLWRDLLMIGAVFDAESQAFTPGCVAGTVIHHLPVRLDVVGDGAIDAYTPPSYGADLLGHWRRSAERLALTGPV